MPNVVSIYSGGGGLDLGFKEAGFLVCISTDHWPVACRTLEKNGIGKKVICKDIRQIDYNAELEEIGMHKDNIDVLIGGPPCPAYSKMRYYQKDKGKALKDENSYTLYEYMRALREIQPKVFLFENVPGFLYKPAKEAFSLLTDTAAAYGYTLSYKVVNAADYGVPQIRERFICVGIKSDLGETFLFPKETHYNPEESKAHSIIEKKEWLLAGYTHLK